MKYGNIICDPTLEEAKALIGKTVIASNIFTDIMGPKWFGRGTLLAINIGDVYPFRVGDPSAPNEYTFIREVIEEKPKYRPYKDCEEMIDDFCERSGLEKTDFAIPMIWVKLNKSERRMLATQFAKEYVSLEGITNRTLLELFNEFTYLDGSTVGKMVTQ